VLGRIVGDNLDFEVRARIQTKESCNKSIHWTHQCAVLDRVFDPSLDASSPKKDVKDVRMIELLPDSKVQEHLMKNWSVLISRVIVKHLKAFKKLTNVVNCHIPHKHSEEMRTKSELVSTLC
jgi:hypothetical protein